MICRTSPRPRPRIEAGGEGGRGTETVEAARAAGIETPLQVACQYCRKEFYVELPSTLMGLREMYAAGFICSKCDLIEQK